MSGLDLEGGSTVDGKSSVKVGTITCGTALQYFPGLFQAFYH